MVESQIYTYTMYMVDKKNIDGLLTFTKINVLESSNNFDIININNN